MKYAAIVAVAGLGLLAACGTNPQERTSGGAAAGAATGAGVGALAGPPGMAVGAVIGGGAGAITGAETKPSQVNLGKPPWTNPDTRVPTASGAAHPASSKSASKSTDQLNDASYNAARQTN